MCWRCNLKNVGSLKRLAFFCDVFRLFYDYVQSTFGHLGNTRRSSSSLRSLRSNQQWVSLPHDSDTLNAMSALQLGALVAGWPDSEKQTAIKLMESQGLSSFTRLIRLSVYNRCNPSFKTSLADFNSKGGKFLNWSIGSILSSMLALVHVSKRV